MSGTTSEQDVQVYLDQHKIQGAVEEAINACVKAQAPDPRAFMAKYLVDSKVGPETAEAKPSGGLLDLGAVGDVPSYTAPPWLPAHLPAPTHKLTLGHLPTPIHRWALPGAGAAQVFIKRDDCSGCELSGNKVRKLEFLLASALKAGCDSVITVGGIQSNHCRATSAAARRVGLTPHILLRTATPGQEPGLAGNLLVDRMVGAEIHLVGDEEFAAKGGWGLVCELKTKLEAQGAKPYAFPSGGSNAEGTWGYVNAVLELEAQLAGSVPFDRIYFGCGSGGTAAGLALGMHYCGAPFAKTELVALGVDDTPDDFYSKVRAAGRETPRHLSLHVPARTRPCGAPHRSCPTPPPQRLPQPDRRHLGRARRDRGRRGRRAAARKPQAATD